MNVIWAKTLRYFPAKNAGKYELQRTKWSLPFLLSNSSSSIRHFSKSWTFITRSCLSIPDKIPFKKSRRPNAKSPRRSSFSNKIRTTWVFLSFSSKVSLAVQTEMSCCSWLLSSRARLICSSNSLYSFLLSSNFLTFWNNDHSPTAFSSSFHSSTWSMAKLFRSSSSRKSESALGMSSGLDATSPLHIKSKCSCWFSWSSRWLISKRRWLYST